MKKLVPLLAVFFSACVDRHVLINRHYHTDGYTVNGIFGKWTWDEEKQSVTLKVGEGFDERVYTDRPADGAVDTVVFRYETYSRSAPGSKELFERADSDLDTAKSRYDIEGIDKEWRAMTPDERVRREDYFK